MTDKNVYEESVKRLEEIVKTLESGSCPLEESIKLFEEGASLVKKAEKLLEEAEHKVKILVNGTEQDFAGGNG